MQINERDQEALSRLKSSRGWKILVEEIEERVKDLEDSLFSFSTQDIIDGKTKYDKLYSVFDLKSYERAILKGLKDLPDELIDSKVQTIAGQFE